MVVKVPGGCNFFELSRSKLWSVVRIQSIRYAMASELVLERLDNRT